MATYYALPTLAVWHGQGVSNPGWSLSSGGADAGVNPSAGDDVIFDGNSGPSRTIEVMYGATGRTWTITSASSFTFNLYPGQSDQMFIGDGSSNTYVNLSGNHVVNVHLLLQGNSGYTTTINAPGTTFKIITQSGQAVTVSGNLRLTSYYGWNNTMIGSLQVSGSPTIRMEYISPESGNTLSLGSATWEFTTANSNAIGSNGTLNIGTSTVKMVDASSGIKTLNPGKALYNVVVEAGGVVDVHQSGATLNSLTVKPAAGASSLEVRFPQSQLNASTIIIDGTARPTTIKSFANGSQATLNKVGGGAVYIDNCSVRDISGTTGTFRARNCVDLGNNLGITFVPANRGMLSFF